MSQVDSLLVKETLKNIQAFDGGGVTTVQWVEEFKFLTLLLNASDPQKQQMLRSKVRGGALEWMMNLPPMQPNGEEWNVSTILDALQAKFKR